MFDKELLIDLEEQENETKEQKNETKEQKNINQSFGINIDLNEEETKQNNINKNEEDKNEKNKNKEDIINEEKYGVKMNLEENQKKTSLGEDTIEENDNINFIKQITENGVKDDGINDEVYNQILNKTKKKNKLIYVSLTFFMLSIIGTGGIYLYQSNSNYFDNYLTSILGNVKQNIIDTNSEHNKKEVDKEQSNVINENDIVNKYKKEVDKEQSNVINENDIVNKYKKDLDDLKLEITSYYKDKLVENIKNLDKETKEKNLFKFNVLRYEFNNKTIDFKTFDNQFNNLINDIK